MQLNVFKTADELYLGMAEWITGLIQEKLKRQDRFPWLLSGGNTPKPLYSLLASDKFKDRIDWKNIHVFFGDERVVPFDDERNNGLMAHDTLLKHLPIPKKQVHYINTVKDPSIASSDYEKVLHKYFDQTNNSFDLALLGMGDDGHTLSLFPGSPLVSEHGRWVSPVYLTNKQADRITLTALIVNKSSHVAFIVTGASKAKALKEVMNGESQPELYPAQVIKPGHGLLHWFVDKEAMPV